MAATMSNSPLLWRPASLMPLLSAVDLPALHGAPTPGIQCHGRTAALQDRWEMERLCRPATRRDQRPTHCIIPITGPQPPDGMQMLREDHHGDQQKRVAMFGLSHDSAQPVDMAQQYIGTTV